MINISILIVYKIFISNFFYNSKFYNYRCAGADVIAAIIILMMLSGFEFVLARSPWNACSRNQNPYH